jgi:hypothetical protein
MKEKNKPEVVPDCVAEKMGFDITKKPTIYIDENGKLIDIHYED